MKPHDHLSRDDRERAAQYAIGGLEPDAARLYEAHLEICPACRAEVLSCRPGVEALARCLPPEAPPPSLKARLMERVRGGASDADGVQSWKRWLPDRPEAGSIIVRGGDEDWQATAVEGVRVRRLFVDRANDRITMLVRMNAGTEYPAHRHGGIEECYVLEGDLYGPDFEMTAGDYQRLDSGTTHGVQGTRGGCLLFIVSSMHDELLPERAL